MRYYVNRPRRARRFTSICTRFWANSDLKTGRLMEDCLPSFSPSSDTLFAIGKMFWINQLVFYSPKIFWTSIFNFGLFVSQKTRYMWFFSIQVDYCISSVKDVARAVSFVFCDLQTLPNSLVNVTTRQHEAIERNSAIKEAIISVLPFDSACFDFQMLEKAENRVLEHIIGWYCAGGLPKTCFQ